VVEEFTPPLGFCGLPWWTRKPVILITQWYFFEQWESRYHLPFRRGMQALAAQDRYHYVITQTQAMGRELKRYLPRATIRCIPSGVDDGAFVDAPVPGDYVLFLGRLDIEHKGLDLLIDAWKRVCASARVPLVIAGEGLDRPKIEAWIVAHGLGDLVRMAGRVEGTAKTTLLAGCRFVVMPSRYETFGIAALEAMAASKAVVCFDIEHLNEVAMAPWASPVPKLDASALGGAVVALWNAPERCREMGQQARERARQYRWDEIARQQEEFYLEIAHAHEFRKTA
jgi:glycosyltransferase involved in cell wall biosynthesis